MADIGYELSHFLFFLFVKSVWRACVCVQKGLSSVVLHAFKWEANISLPIIHTVSGFAFKGKTIVSIRGQWGNFPKIQANKVFWRVLALL